MAPVIQWPQAAMILGVYVLGNYSHKRHLDRLEETMNRCIDEMNKRFDDLQIEPTLIQD